MASTSLDTLTADTRAVVNQLLASLQEAGLRYKVVSTLRTCSEQHQLFLDGTTRADGCRSWHVWGRAVDILLLDEDGAVIHNGADARYARMGALAEQLGMVWGGRFNDPLHVEYHPGLTQGGVCPDPSLCEQLVGAGQDPPVAPDPNVEPVQYTQAAAGTGVGTWVAALGLGAGAFFAVRHLVLDRR